MLGGAVVAWGSGGEKGWGKGHFSNQGEEENVQKGEQGVDQAHALREKGDE